MLNMQKVWPTGKHAAPAVPKSSPTTRCCSSVLELVPRRARYYAGSACLSPGTRRAVLGLVAGQADAA